MALTIKQVEVAKPCDKSYKLSDENGLYLQIHTNGSKYWRYNYTDPLTKKQRTKSYGVFPKVSIAEARKKHAEFQDEKTGNAQSEHPSILLIDVFKQFVIKRLKHLSPKYATQTERRVFLDIIGTREKPILGWKAIHTIKRHDLITALDTIAARGAIDSAHRMADTVERIFDFAIDIGVIESHPASGLERGLPPAPAVQHQAAIDQQTLPQLITDIDSYGINPITRLGMLLMLCTFVRTGQELRRAKWTEFDFEARVWTLPKERMKGTVKTKTTHFVHLSNFALNVLDALRQLNGDQEYILASLHRRAHPVNASFILNGLEYLGYKGEMTGHGFRSVASTWFNERGFNPDAVEVQLSHKIESVNAVRGAYNRARYWDERVRMMDAWGEYIQETLSQSKHV